MRQRSTTLALAALLATAATATFARPALAQDEEPPIETGFTDAQAAAYLALTITPVGALAPSQGWLLRRPGEAPPPMRLHAHVATMDRGAGIGQRVVAATLDMPAGAAALSITAGYLDVTCDDEATGGFDVGLECGGGLTVGARLGRALASRSLDAAGSSALVVGVEGTAGWASLDVLELEVFGTAFDVSAQGMSATAALPIALVARSGTTVVSPGIRPAVGWGRTRVDFGDGEDDNESGVRAMFGAGVAVRFADRVGLELGLQRVFFDEADTTFGVGISFGF